MLGAIILRVVGVSLAVLGALGAVLALAALFNYVYGPGDPYTIFFSASASAAGVIAARARPIRHGPLFWVAVLGCAVCAPVLIYLVVKFIFEFVSGDDPSIAMLFLGLSSSTWWPPKDLDLGELIRRAFGLSYGSMPPIFSNWAVWLHLPVAACLWAIWGKRGGMADKIFGAIMLLLAGLAALLAACTAALEIETAGNTTPECDIVDDTCSIFDYAYIPEPSWFLYYAILILWFVALAVLLFGRRPETSSMAA
jgi:hypothetical protein